MGDVVPFAPPPLAPRDPRFLPRPVEMVQLAGVWREMLPPGQWNAELKVDGVRALWADGALWSREGVPLDLPHLAADLQRLERRFGEPMAIDGEYQEPDGFLDTLSAIKARGRRQLRGVLHVFDAVPLAEWREDACEEPLARRRRWLARAWEGFEPATLRRIMPHAVASASDVDRLTGEVWRAGGEGLVLKRCDSLYRRARSSDWLKVKREITHTGEIVEVIEGRRGARVAIAGRVGRVVRVGLTQGQAETLSVGMSVQIEAMEWTERGALRHARIVAIGKV